MDGAKKAGAEEESCEKMTKSLVGQVSQYFAGEGGLLDPGRI